MKKIFLLIAFAGIVGASTANSIASLNVLPAVTFKQDDKKKPCCKKDAKHDCSKHAKGDCKKDGKGHDCSKHAKGECNKGMSDSTKHDCSKHKKGKKDCCKKHEVTPVATPSVTPSR